MAEAIYFKNLVNIEITKLTKLCDKWDYIHNKEDTPEEEKGGILAVLGMSKLLIKEKIKQFTDLIETCEKGESNQKITFDDLRGFWDLVCIQIEDIKNQFSKLEIKEANKWQPLSEEIENTNIETKKKSKKLPSIKSLNEAAKKRLLAAKAAMREKILKDENTIC